MAHATRKNRPGSARLWKKQRQLREKKLIKAGMGPFAAFLASLDPAETRYQLMLAEHGGLAEITDLLQSSLGDFLRQPPSPFDVYANVSNGSFHAIEPGVVSRCEVDA